MHDQLVALVFAVWAALPGQLSKVTRSPEAMAIADAIAEAVEGEASPAEGESHAMDASLLALYAARESGVSTNPTAVSWDAKAGLSIGVWQMRWFLVKGHTLTEQARFWLDAVRRAGVVGADSSPARSKKRTEEARNLLRVALVEMGTTTLPRE